MYIGEGISHAAGRINMEGEKAWRKQGKGNRINMTCKKFKRPLCIYS